MKKLREHYADVHVSLGFDGRLDTCKHEIYGEGILKRWTDVQEETCA